VQGVPWAQGGGGICSKLNFKLKLKTPASWHLRCQWPGNLPRVGRVSRCNRRALAGPSPDDTTVMGHCGTVTVTVSPAARATGTWHSESLRLAGTAPAGGGLTGPFNTTP
jgi:hypothetical protein